MSNVEQKKSNKSASIIIVILIILIVVVGAIIYFSLNDIRNVTFTEDNIDKTMDRISTEMHDTDDIYYLGYSMFYYMAKDGISSALIGNDVESAMYENIYGNQTYMQSGDIEVKLDELSGAFHISNDGKFFINQTEINN